MHFPATSNAFRFGRPGNDDSSDKQPNEVITLCNRVLSEFLAFHFEGHGEEEINRERERKKMYKGEQERKKRN